jgi:hypothetical protein
MKPLAENWRTWCIYVNTNKQITMDEVLEQVAMMGQLIDVWHAINKTALDVLRSIENAVDATTAKIKALTDGINSVPVTVKQYEPNVPTATGANRITNNGVTTNSIAQTNTITNTETKERGNAIDTTEKMVKTGKDVIGMAKMVTSEFPQFEKLNKGIEGIAKVFEFGEKGIGVVKNFIGLMGTGAVEESAAAIAGGLDIAAIIEVVSAIAIATGPVGWAIGGAALAAGGAAAWYMSSKEKEKYQYSGNKGLGSFANAGDDYIAKGKQWTIPSFLAPNKKDGSPNTLTPFSPPVSTVDKTYVKSPVIIPAQVDAVTIFKRGVQQGLLNLGTSKAKDAFDNYSLQLSAMADYDPRAAGYISSVLKQARQKLVNTDNANLKAKQQLIAKQYVNQQGQLSSPGTTININTPLIGTFNIQTKNMNESYDKVKQEILQVLLEVFNRAAPAH